MILSIKIAEVTVVSVVLRRY